MRLLRYALAPLLLALGVAAVLIAADLRSWRNALAAGDAVYAHAPANATWKASTILPSGLSERILGLPAALAFRGAAQGFVAVHDAGNGVDNGYSESRTRAGIEAELLGIAQGPQRLLDSEAQNLLGILAFADSQQNGPSGPAPVDRSVADFQAAVQDDPENTDAKYNLELLLHDLIARGERSGSNGSSSGPAKGHRGANGGAPGSGY